ncbi:MAG TPA: PAS domain S-box protein [Candidatus Acidoferrales bacterium]|nr:PAS domain S-box protein [Candidatus Acidoferrales bacterium]
MPRIVRDRLCPAQRIAPVAWVLVVTLTLLSVLTLSSAAAGQSNHPKRILILMENDATWPAFRRIEQNARTTLLSKLPSDTQVFNEDMDRGLFDEPLLLEEQAALIQHKYSKIGLDLVIAVGNVPLELFPGVPLVYVGSELRRTLPGQPAASTPVARIWGTFEAQKNLEAALRLQPDAHQIVVIGGTSLIDREILEQVRDQLSRSSSKLPITYWTDLALPAICQRVAGLGPNSIVLFVSLARDGGGHNFIPAEAVAKIIESSGAPVYVFFDTLVGSGAVGGYVLSAAALGKQAGQTGLRMLAGEHPADAEVPDVCIYDWRQLQRWGLSAKKLPAGSTLLNQPATMWELYKWPMVGATALLFIQTLLIVGLLFQRKRRRHAEQSLARQLRFEALVREFSADLTGLPGSRIDEEIKKALSRLRLYLALDRISIYEFVNEVPYLKLRLSERADGTPEAPRFLHKEVLPRLFEQLDSEKMIFLKQLEDLPEDAVMERSLFRELGIQSAVLVPLKAQNSMTGLLCFVRTQSSSTWPADLLPQFEAVGQVFANAMLRKQGEEQLEESQNQLASIVSSAMDAIIAVDEEQRIVVFNTSAEQMFGCSVSEAIGSSIDRFIPQRFRVAHESHLRQFSETGATNRAMGTLGALWALRTSGEEFPIEATISQTTVGGAKLFTVIIRDVAQRRLAESAVRESEDRFRLVADAAPVLIWMSGPDKLCTFFNQGWLDFTGQSLEHELGEGWTSGVHPDDLGHCLRAYSDSFDARTDFEIEYRLRRHDGEYRWIVDYGVPRFEPDGTFCGFIGSAIDITERKSSEAALHELSGRLIHAQEEERTRIARELHDDFSQRLALLGIGLGQLWKHLPEADNRGRVQVGEMWTRTKELSSDVHRLCHQLHSSKLELIGLSSALSGVCGEIGEKYGIKVEFADLGAPSKVPKEVALCLFRVAQEALNNVVKHSKAKQARVELSGANGDIVLRVADEGLGFEPAPNDASGGIGLIGMRERLRLVDGKLEVRTAPMRGTEIVAEVPLPAAATNVEAKSQIAGGSVR